MACSERRSSASPRRVIRSRRDPETCAARGARLLEYAIRTISGRGLSVSELRNKLARRAASPADIEKVMGKLKDAGALDDRRFAEHFASSRLENQGFGKMRVLRDLRARRVAPAVADEAIGATYGEVDETALIENYIERKFRGKM